MKGIDVSSYQTGIDYQAVASKIDFAILRACWGENEDLLFQTHAAGFRKAGVPVLGIYCFDYALDEGQAVAEADCLIRLARAAGLPESTVLYFDCEGDSVRWASQNGVDLNADLVQSHTRAFMDRVAASGYRAGFYSNLDWMRRIYNGFERKPGEKFWFARYDHEPEFEYDVLQYTSQGTIPGIAGTVDMNEMKDEEESVALPKIDPDQWISDHKGKIYDIDGVYGIQCVDLFKIFLKEIGFPNPSGPIGGDGYADYIWYGRDKYKDYFTFETGELKKGDIVLWAKGSPDCPYSHVAMFVEDSPKGGNRGIFLGSNQGYTHSNGNLVDINCSGALGALRYKGFAKADPAADSERGKLIAEHRKAKVKRGHNINLRLGGPKGRVIGQIKEGESLEYDHKIVTNGHRYVVNGNLYMAVTPTEARSDYWVDILPA